MIEVEGPDGAIHEFPEGTKPDIIKGAMAKRYAKPPAKPGEKPHTYSVLPLSEDAQGRVSFDSNAGVMGALKRAFTLPGDVVTGKVDPSSDEGLKRAFEMATVVSPASVAARAGEMAVPGAMKAMRPAKVTPPSAEALYGAASGGYTLASELGVDYAGPAVSQLAASLRAGLENDGVLAELAPKSFKILEKLENAPEGSVAPLSGIEAARRAFGHASKDFNNPTDQFAASHIIDGLDDFMVNPPAQAVAAGPADLAAQIVKDARGNYAAAKRSDKITGIEEAADLRASATNSGQNLDNTIRQRVASLLLNPKQRAGFSEQEIASLEEVSRGTPTRNAARFLGNLLGGGGGLGSVVTSMAGAGAGGAAAGPQGAFLGAAAPAIGYGAKKLSNRMTEGALSAADDLVRQRSPLFEQMRKDAPGEVISPERRAALIRALMLIREAPANQMRPASIPET